MSSVFSKNKEKRQRSTSSEGNTSFVKNVTSRMSGFLPSTITKWFSSPSSSNTNGSAPAAEISDSSTDDESLDSPAVPQPPKKRMRYNTPPQYEHFSTADINSSVTKIKTSEPIYSLYNATPFPTRSTLNAPVISLNEDDTEKTTKEPKKFKSEHTVSSVGQSVAGKRKSLFERVVSEQSEKASTQTSLNALCGVNQTYFKSAYFVSPFYTGRTAYGGAASTYVNRPNIKQKKVAIVKKSQGDDSAISNSARRIIDLLEQYSSPVVDAKRLPNYTKPKKDSFNNSTDQQSSSFSNRNTSYKMQELHVPSMASILRLKQKSRLMDTTSAARQIIASHSSAINYPYPSSSTWKPMEEQSNKLTTKVKARVTRTQRGNQNELEVATPVNLPAPALHIDQDKLPKFSFGTPNAQLIASATSTPKGIVEATANKKSTTLSSSNRGQVNYFTFSNPETVPCDSSDEETSIPKYQFYSPERRIEQKIDQKKDNISTAAGPNKAAPQKPTVTSNDWKCADCCLVNKADANECVCCGAKQPSKNAVKCAKCTVCKLADSQALKDKCVNCEKMQITNVTSPIVVPTASDASKWKCDECWVSNDNSAERCACCGAVKAKKSVGALPTPTAVSSTAKRGDADWKCGECWISNKSSADKCVACGEAKPGTKTGAAAPAARGSSFLKTSNDTLKDIVQAQKKETWECQSCLVRNEANVSSCVCCGTEKENKNKMPGNKFNFGLNNSFKFGINHTTQDAALAKQPELGFTPQHTSKEQSEKNNNILAETPTFTIQLPAQKPEEKTQSSTTNLPKPSFTFGIPNQSTPAPATMFKPLSPTTTVQEDKEKPQEVPQMKLSAPNPMFSTPLPHSAPSSTQALSTSNAFSSPTTDAKKEVTSVSITLKPPAMNAEKPQQQNTFTFGASSLKPAAFGSPTTMAEPPTRNLFTPPSQSTVTSTAAPTMSFFKPTESAAPSLFEKPNPTTTSTVSLFQSGETTTTAPVSSAAVAAPMFSFGTKLPTNSAPEPEKSAFFSFGNNVPKSDAQPVMFKPTFGTASESNANTNIFGISGGNTLGTGHVLGSSASAAGNSLTTGGFVSSGSGTATNNSLAGTNGLSTTPQQGANNMQPISGISNNTTNLFTSGQKENVWSSNTPSANLFVPNTTASSQQKPSFTFGSTGGFNASGQTPAFGGGVQPPQNNIFGMANQNSNNNGNINQPSIFSNQVHSQQPAPLFGAPQPAAASSAPQMMFGSPSVGATQAFGVPNQSMPSFEASSMSPAPAPAPSFNFGGQQSTAMFGFGQQQQPQQAGVYNFGGGQPAVGGAMQFNMGSGVPGRRVRKAVRRNPPR